MLLAPLIFVPVSHTPVFKVRLVVWRSDLIRQGVNAKHWANVVTTLADRFSLISQSILNRFTCNFAHTIRSHCGDCPENVVRFDRVFQKLLMWCTETTLFPHRQSAENAGRHWNSTKEVPSPHITCVTEQLELTRQVARIERVIINTTST